MPRLQSAPHALIVLLALALSACAVAEPTAHYSSTNPAKTATAEQRLPTLTKTPPASPTPLRPMADMTEFQKGVAYVSWQHGELSSGQSDKTLSERIVPLGVNWISVVVTCYQKDIASTSIQCRTSKDTPSDTDLRHVISYAHSLGLRVMLKPHIDLYDDLAHWRGQIGSGNDEQTWNAWFTSYQAVITRYAELARELDVDYFVVGTELTAASHREANWRRLVEVIRQVYPGPLTYAANHDGEEMNVRWWDALDAIGVDAYYPLTRNPDPTVEDIKDAWKPIIMRLEALSTRWELPIILTEIGYQSLDGTNRTPWEVVGTSLDLQEQADCYQAFFEAFDGKPWWRGVYWWAWDTNPLQGGSVDGDFTANNKPAEEVLRVAYGMPPRPTPTATPVLVPDESTARVIYDDALAPKWEDWSWYSTVNLASTEHVHSGSAAIEVGLDPTGALSFHFPGFNTMPYQWLEFYIYVEEDTTRRLSVYFNDVSDTELMPKARVDQPSYIEGGEFLPDRWQKVLVPLADTGGAGIKVVRINIKDESGAGQLLFWIDDIRFLGAVPASP
jgi:hypothetical protein